MRVEDLYEFLNLHACKAYLADLLNLESKNSFNCPLLREDEIESLIKLSYELSTDAIVKLLARSIFTLLSTKDFLGKFTEGLFSRETKSVAAVKILAIRLSFQLMNLEGASAAGCCQVNIFNTLSGQLVKPLREILLHWEEETSKTQKKQVTVFSQFLLSLQEWRTVFDYLEGIHDFEPLVKCFLYFFYIGIVDNNQEFIKNLHPIFCKVFWTKKVSAIAVNSVLLPILTWKPDSNDGFYPNEKSFKHFYLAIVKLYKSFLSYPDLNADCFISIQFQFNLSFSLIQRIVIKCPEKASMKSIACDSVADIVMAMIHKFPKTILNSIPLDLSAVQGSGTVDSPSSQSIRSSKSLNGWQEEEDEMEEENEIEEILDFQHALTEFFLKLCRSKLPANRGNVLDFITSILLCNKENDSEVQDMEKISVCSFTQDLFNALVDRCYDSSPIVRLRTMSNLAHLVEDVFNHQDTFQTLQEAIKKVLPMLLDISLAAIKNEKPQFRGKALSFYTYLLFFRNIAEDENNASVLQALEDPFEGNELEVFLTTANDPNSSVRRQTVASLNILLIKYKGSNKLKQYWINSLLPLVSDAFSSVAEKVASCMNEMIFKSLSEWTHQLSSSASSGKDFPSLPLELLYLIDEQSLTPLFQTVVQKLFVVNGTIASSATSHNKQGVLEDILDKCITIVETASLASESSNHSISLQDQYGCWILIEVTFPLLRNSLTPSSGREIVSFFFDCLERFISNSYHISQGHDHASVLNRKILNKLVHLFHQSVALCSKDQIEEIQRVFRKLLTTEEINTDLLEILIQTMFEITKYQVLFASNANNKKKKEKQLPSTGDQVQELSRSVLLWATPLFDRIYANLLGYSSSSGSSSEKLLIRSLLALGGLVLIGFRKEESEPTLLKGSSNSIQFHANIEQELFYFVFPDNILPSLITLIEVSCSREGKSDTVSRKQPKKNSSHTSSAPSSSSPGTIMMSAISILTLGKFCLRSQQLARHCIPLLLKYLHQCHISLSLATVDVLSTSATSSVLRVNLLHVLSDLCIRYTHLLHHHVHDLTLCLHDDCHKVRRTTFLLLSNLLLQDFIKWKGGLFYEFLTLLIDDDLELVNIVKRMLTKTLLTKFPDLYRNHFSTTFFALNHYENPVNFLNSPNPVTSSSSVSASKGKKIISEPTGVVPLSAGHSVGRSLTQNQRFIIYSFLSSEFSDEMKLEMIAKIVNDILVPAVDNTSQLLRDHNQRYDITQRLVEKENFEAALEDALLYLKSLSLESHKDKSDANNFGSEESEAMENELNANPALSEARKKILKTLSKQQLINQILPVVISLKRCLERLKSPIQKYVMEYLIVLFHQNKVEIEQALQFDPIIKAEMEYDLRQFERLSQMQKSASTPRKQSTQSNPALQASGRVSFGAAVAVGAAASSMKKPALKPASSTKKTPLQALLNDDIVVESASRRRSWGVVFNDITTDVSIADENMERSEPEVAPAKRSRRSSFDPKVANDLMSSLLVAEEPKIKSSEKIVKQLRKEKKTTMDSLLSTLL